MNSFRIIKEDNLYYVQRKEFLGWVYISKFWDECNLDEDSLGFSTIKAARNHIDKHKKLPVEIVEEIEL